MTKIHEDFTTEIQKLGFRKDHTSGYDWRFHDGTWLYLLNFEGYAYVLYKQINIYRKPFKPFFLLYNKFRKGSAQINLYYAVPIAHFRNPNDLKEIMIILTNKLESDD